MPDAGENAKEKRDKERKKEKRTSCMAKSGNLVSKSPFFFHVF